MKTTCPHCDAEFNVQPQWIGTTMACPFCRESITVAADSDEESTDMLTDFLDEEPPQRKTKTCPMCGSVNSARADACRACGEPLTIGRVFRDGKKAPSFPTAVSRPTSRPTTV